MEIIMKENEQEVVDLINAIQSRLKKVHTQRLDLSFNELLDMYETGELNIQPEYQRLLQWSTGTQSRFIESLLLEMPVPPIYVIEEDDGKYLLIDGLQRISSYLHLRGSLEAPHLDPPVRLKEKLKLRDCDIVKELNGKTFDDLGTALQIRLKRAFVGVEVVRKGSDPRFKYHMFKRLNTGGQLLSDQQIRNCTIRLLDPKFNDFIIALSNEEVFLHCTENLTQQHRLTAFDQELVLRFFAFKNNRKNFKHDVADFLTEYMEAVSDPESKVPFDYQREKEIFIKTFSVLDKTLGEFAFSFVGKKKGELTRGFSVYHYEAFTIGLQSALDHINIASKKQMSQLKEVFQKIKKDNEFIQITTGGGKNSPGPLRERINFVQKRIEEVEVV
jgi:hypothetical protein